MRLRFQESQHKQSLSKSTQSVMSFGESRLILIVAPHQPTCGVSVRVMRLPQKKFLNPTTS
jgi:hypothetical protein